MLPRLLLLACPFVCAFQWWVVSEYGEPYPALILPAFGGVPKETSYERQSVLMFREGQLLSQHSAYDLFPDLPRAHQYTVVRRHLHYSAKSNPAIDKYLAPRAKRLAPEADLLVVQWEQADFSNSASKWLGKFSVPLPSE